jgi:tetratricopeptide (TPR) repeat protein
MFNGSHFLRLSIVCLAICCLGIAAADAGEFELGVEQYYQNKLAVAETHFAEAVKADPGNAEALAYLAETQRRLKRPEALATAQQVLLLDICHSFAHLTIAALVNPMYGSGEKTDHEDTWRHLNQAIFCDSADGNAWLDIWTQAIFQEDWEIEKLALHKFIETGILAPAVLAYNRWVLRHLPKDAVLLTNGDLDTYPAVALQEVENLRPDVAIVNLPLLNTPWYRRFVRDHYGVAMPFYPEGLDALQPIEDATGKRLMPSTQVVQQWLEQQRRGNFHRPVTFALTVVNSSSLAGGEQHLLLRGGHYLRVPEPSTKSFDTAAVHQSLLDIKPVDYSGSLVSNLDRSPVRHVSTNRIVVNITHLALSYSQALLDSGQPETATQWLDWAEEFEGQTLVGPIMTERIAKLRKSISQEK